MAEDTRTSQAEAETEPVGLDALVPEGWFAVRDRSSVWLRAFRMARVVGQDQLASGPRIVDIGSVRGVVFFGTLRYCEPSSWTVDLPGTPEPTLVDFKADGAQMREKVGVWLVLLTPIAVDGTPGDEVEVRQRIESVAGLFAAFEGFNIVYESSPENIYDLGTTSLTAHSPFAINPYTHAVPNLSESHLSRIAKAARKIEVLPPDIRNRVNLALHWLHLAMRDAHTDAFLKRWIALEVLVMPNRTDIKPINRTLAAAYGVSYEVACDTFRVGLLADMRARIVHRGQPLPIHADLEDYMDALFFDVFAQTIGEPSDRCAESVLSKVGTDFWRTAVPLRSKDRAGQGERPARSNERPR